MYTKHTLVLGVHFAPIYIAKKIRFKPKITTCYFINLFFCNLKIPQKKTRNTYTAYAFSGLCISM